MIDFVALTVGFLAGIGVAVSWAMLNSADEYKEASLLRDMLRGAEEEIDQLQRDLHIAVETAYKRGNIAAKSWALKNYPHWVDGWKREKGAE
ncbi:hypothetical protein [Caulobacter phage KcrB]|nr:hypothetical protein RW_GP044 [Caulobacter phage RW]WCA46348.1 hypothetical protein [Caulobacter phage KcrB]WCD56283.1 hypothetical protein [Caulobacter phage RLK]WNV48075.1 hypothetical protein GB2A_gp043 [Caulobacter phage GB2A]